MAPGKNRRNRLVESESMISCLNVTEESTAEQIIVPEESSDQNQAVAGISRTTNNLIRREPDKIQLTVFEKTFLLAVQRGDVVAVKRLLDKQLDVFQLNVNCTDPLGRTALVVAIENENMELIQLFLSCDRIQTGDALLHAISEQYVEAVEVLLKHEERIHVEGEQYSWEKVESRSATYTQNITPLILAAHKNNYEILKLLLDRGASLPSPHDVRCSCDECLLDSKEDCLRHSRSRISAYQALSSPSLIVLSSKDPVLRAFNLSNEMKRLSSIENEFTVEYQHLRGQLQNFVTSVLNHIRTSHELSVVLNYDPQNSFKPMLEPRGNRMSLERLKLAIKLEQKSFVAHPSVQQLLATVWFEGMPGFRRKSPLGQAVELAKLGAFFPLYCTAYLLAPRSRLGLKIKQPFVKFICHSASYCFFLLLVMMASQRVDVMLVDFFGTSSMREWMDEYQRKERGKLPSIVEIPIIFYIFGFVWEEVKQLWDAGLLNYAKDMWNILDVISNSLYLTWIGLRTTAYFQVRRELSAGMTAHLPREYWHPYDPHLISEGIFGAAIIISILKLVNIFSINPHLGPLQISLGRMVLDIVKFFFIYTLVVVAFGVGMNQLLWYYAEMDKNICYGKMSNKTDSSCEIWRRFSNLFETSQSLFWASFGLVELNNFELTGIKSFTRFWAMLMFGCYSVINIVVLLNLLIAMMSSSYQIISEHSDTEWKFARSKLWMSYFEEGDTVPPPFNIIPGTKLFFKMKPFQPKKPTNSIKIKHEENRDAEYEDVMRCLVKRYVTEEQRRSEASPVTEDDVKEVKQDIATFKCELFEILRTNGMRCQQVRLERDANSGKREREFERRLLKDFNIGLVQSAVGAVLRSSRGSSLVAGRSSPGGFDVLRRMTGHRVKAQRNWNALVRATQSRHSQIGSTDNCQSIESLDELKNVIQEQMLEVPSSSGTQVSPIRNILREKIKNRKVSLERLGQETQKNTEACHSYHKSRQHHSYHVHLHQDHQGYDPDRRLDFCGWLDNQLDDDPHLTKTILWTDEASFSRDDEQFSQSEPRISKPQIFLETVDMKQMNTNSQTSDQELLHSSDEQKVEKVSKGSITKQNVHRNGLDQEISPSNHNEKRLSASTPSPILTLENPKQVAEKDRACTSGEVFTITQSDLFESSSMQHDTSRGEGFIQMLTKREKEKPEVMFVTDNDKQKGSAVSPKHETMGWI